MSGGAKRRHSSSGFKTNADSYKIYLALKIHYVHVFTVDYTVNYSKLAAILLSTCMQIPEQAPEISPKPVPINQPIKRQRDRKAADFAMFQFVAGLMILTAGIVVIWLLKR